MKISLRTAALALILLRISSADDAVFQKSILIKSGNATPAPVDLIVSDSGVTIRGKGNAGNVIAEFPYSAIKKLGYTFMNQKRDSLMPLIGVTALFIKGQSHWLLIEPVAGGEDAATILRLDKTEYSGVIAAFESKSGKPVEMLVPSQILDPFSRDEDETVSYREGQVVTALESAMAQFSCKVGKSKPDRVNCTRLFRPADGIGGGEAVTAVLESKGEQTRVQIKTQKGMGRDWSTPIYREMLRRLQSAK